jgi:2-polyprenyl-3-methyl-5-hydroxy-6-metoxy-1,4-benzoquinol methylase
VNFKLLLPTYRTRERFVREVLAARRVGEPPLGRVLNVGAGEGDIDPTLASYADELESCDVNEDDVAHARALNAGVPNVRYSVQNGESLDFADASFDVVTCLEVIEHVHQPTALLREIARVLKPGGSVVLTCPSQRFPVTYDPVNAVLAPTGKHVSFGAYGYGHSWLVDDNELEAWLEDVGLHVQRKERLSGWLVGALECYWPGVMQRALKANAGNTNGAGRQADGASRPVLRPTAEAPPLLPLVDALIALDRRATAKSRRSVGLGYVLAKA